MGAVPHHGGPLDSFEFSWVLRLQSVTTWIRYLRHMKLFLALILGVMLSPPEDGSIS